MVILTTFPPPSEGIRHKQNNTQAHVQRQGKSGKTLGTGVLYVAESTLSWASTDGPGFSLEYPSISLHAISKDLAAFPQECIYIMIDADIEQEEEGGGNGSGSSSEEEEEPITEIRFIPEDKGALEAIYSAMCDCQALHPDEQQDSLPEDEEDDDYYEGEEGLDHLTEQGQQTLNQLEGTLHTGGGDADEPQIGNRATNGSSGAEPMEADDQMETGQFDDADNM